MDWTKTGWTKMNWTKSRSTVFSSLRQKVTKKPKQVAGPTPYEVQFLAGVRRWCSKTKIYVDIISPCFKWSGWTHTKKSRLGILPSHQLLWFLASIYLEPGLEPLPDLPALSPKVLSIGPLRWWTYTKVAYWFKNHIEICLTMHLAMDSSGSHILVNSKSP